MRQHLPRLLDDGVILVSWRLVGHYSGRSRRVVERSCTPLACDAASGLPLYDLEASLAALGGLAWRPRPPRRQAARDETARHT